MRSAGALIASIGTSVVLVVAVTLALLSISVVFALDGFEGSGDASADAALVLDLKDRSDSDGGSDRTTEAATVAVVDRRAASSRGRLIARRAARGRDSVRANPASATTAAADTSQVASLGRGTASPPATAQESAAAPAAVKPRANTLGNGVKQLGDGLSSTISQGGTKLAEATAPLAPVGAVVQQVLNIVAGVIKATTDGLARLLGAQP